MVSLRVRGGGMGLALMRCDYDLRKSMCKRLEAWSRILLLMIWYGSVLCERDDLLGALFGRFLFDTHGLC